MTPSAGSSVFPTYVGLVPLEDNANKQMRSELVKVAAALQIQVVRDFRPVWGVSAAVVPFASFDEMRDGYIPLAVTTRKLPLHSSGFHFALQGLPFAVVEYRKRLPWSLAASHELLELLAEPPGQRMVLAPSLQHAQKTAEDAPVKQVRDAIRAAIDRPGDREAADGEAADGETVGQSFREDDELFNYILEVCDPCEYSTYTIDGVVVSDFVTPDYYHVGPPWHGPYSFLGRIQWPLAVLEGGYISWRKHPPGGLIYQASSKANEAQLRDKVFEGVAPNVEGVSERMLKRRVVGGSSTHSPQAQGWKHRDEKGPNDAEQMPETAELKQAVRPRFDSSATGRARLRADIDALLAWLAYQAEANHPSVDRLIEDLKDLLGEDTKNPAKWNAFNEDPRKRIVRLGERGLNVDLTRRDPSTLTSIDTLREVLEYLQKQRQLDRTFGAEPIFALWLAVQIG